jgi:paired amphipathic helix protein Sin3a
MGGAPGMKELRVEDALLYLDDVKREFKDRPAIYNEFLAIMKNFKSQEVDTPGVINRVSNLFRGYNKLILGFNTFLPEGYKISLADLERVEQMRQQAEERASREKKPSPLPPHQINISQEKSSPPMMDASMMPKQQQQQQHEWVQSPPPPHPQGIKQLPVQGLQQQQQQQRTSPGAVPSPTPRGGQQQQQQQQQHSTPSQPQQQQQQQQHQAVEFDHAISYVTTIKRRFANDSNTYHTFLEILHTYQKEQRGIKEVLEQVAHLFQDHPDLLKEFTFFLPDAVQEQAKERLHRAAAESENRLLQRQMAQYQQRVGKGASASTAAVGSPSVAAVPASKTSEASNSFIDMTRSQMAGTAADSSERGAAGGRKRATPEVTAAAQLPTPPPPPQQQQQYQPEVYVYNSAVERQFFDTVREALSSHARDGGQAWAEFLKCMDMYAQEILSRTEMLNCVEPLLGKRHSNLLEDFKRILSAAGSPSVPQLMEDSWHSVPLSEIDFSRCRRCSPSYRALPRDYPPHPCSERSDFETKVLNDIWVSLPVGSEESYTFRHMRRNTHEEMLFRVEDERFEIDMAIDSNAATLQRLEPIAEEIALLAQEDVIPGDLGVKSPIDGVGIGGKRYQYIFDKKILGVHHRNSITRIYGDLGQEMLDLLAKNPTVAVPLVVQRLRQKDQEWRQVRKRLNRHWREIQEHNYYRSLDHRSLSWRSSDKRAISARTLIADIKDRAANRGREGKEALRQKLDKAKEERGQFYEVTVGDLLTTDLDLTFLPKSDRRLFTPHLSLLYKNVSWAQRDAYRIMAFALERGPISPSDKERCHRLWVEFFGPWFDLPLSWMQKPAVTYQDTAALKVSLSSPEAQVVSEEDEESMEDRPDLAGKNVVSEPMKTPDLRDREFTDHHPLPAGAHVSSIYGEGKIIEFRREDHIYAVKLPFGTGYLRPATVLCSMLPVEKSAYTRQLRAEDRTKLARPNDQLAFGTQSLYLFFRLHQILVDRLNTAKRLAYSVGEDRSLQTMVSQMPDANPKAVGRQRYEAYLSLVYSLLDGGAGLEGGRYEDLVRSLLGHGAYELATMDKLISHIWKDIQAMANDETMWNLVQLYRRHLLAGSFQPEAFRQEAAYLSDGEQMYAFQHCPVPSTDESVLHMEYLGVMDDDDDEPMEDDIEPIEQPPVNKRQKR